MLWLHKSQNWRQTPPKYHVKSPNCFWKTRCRQCHGYQHIPFLIQTAVHSPQSLLTVLPPQKWAMFCRYLTICTLSSIILVLCAVYISISNYPLSRTTWLFPPKQIFDNNSNSSSPVSTGNTFQDLPRLRETADNTKHYIYRDIRVTYINTVQFNW
jgi:hypothetical protein